ncbi:hypothetical protein [Vibrio furnissii]|uniref:hypothetical protein n=1 Tax=Vibrio furnissii TaxID=29494 RepID=UPI001EEBD638|nr:hypothetical protein [Vibrio furnissii]
MKMSDVFNLPLRAVEPKDIGTGRGAYPVICADCVGDNPRGVIGHLRFETGPHSGTSRHMDYALAKEMTVGACRAINNHDRLTSENERLREMVKAAYIEGSKSGYSDGLSDGQSWSSNKSSSDPNGDWEYSDAKQLLTELLEKGDE